MIFWEHIKGLNKGTEQNASNAWTYINFQQTISGTTMTSNPSIDFGTNGYNSGSNHILTSNMTDGYINNAMTFYGGFFLKQPNTNDELHEWHTPNNAWRVDSNIGYHINTTGSLTLQSTNAAININAANGLNYYQGEGDNNLLMSASSNNGFIFQRPITGDKITLNGDNHGGDGSCTAVYFNATSDYRAKKDFKLLNIDALNLIKKVQLYSFKYKDSNTPSIGMIAQDVQDINIEGFKLVSNEEASGANFDYMTIHESKLIYILWKAIQEQQAEIEQLKQQLNNK